LPDDTSRSAPGPNHDTILPRTTGWTASREGNMIGVIARGGQSPAVKEFFQIFKTPWEFFREDRAYEILLVTENPEILPPAGLIFLFGPGKKHFDEENRVVLHPAGSETVLEHSGCPFPVKSEISLFPDRDDPVLKTADGKGIGGFLFRSGKKNIIRVGFDLFDEVGGLLFQGQDIEYAQAPTLDLLADFVRRWILWSGEDLVEVPPAPHGHDFTVCLTHDVDFMGIRDHLFDRTFFGFLLRSLFPWFFPGYRNKVTPGRYLKNLFTVFKLPLVYLGVVKDPWYNLGRYIRLEGSLPSTFFFIPWGGDEGKSRPEGYQGKGSGRAARYDLKEHGSRLSFLREKGKEIGLHGIDAWSSSLNGEAEKKAVQEVSKKDVLGVRMHWLYFDRSSSLVLEETGFLYDSTVGYNETIGFKTGSAQVYLPPGNRSLLELPMIIQDSALFYPGRMGLDEKAALSLCLKVIDMVSAYGGVLTINWHHRSLSPERNWDSFYVNLVKILRERGAWFAQGSQAVEWFRKRREVKFQVSGEKGDLIRLVPGLPNDSANGATPELKVRKYIHGVQTDLNPHLEKPVFKFLDEKWNTLGELEVRI